MTKLFDIYLLSQNIADTGAMDATISALLVASTDSTNEGYAAIGPSNGNIRNGWIHTSKGSHLRQLPVNLCTLEPNP